jgi:hypothetical protein
MNSWKCCYEDPPEEKSIVLIRTKTSKERVGDYQYCERAYFDIDANQVIGSKLSKLSSHEWRCADE